MTQPERMHEIMLLAIKSLDDLDDYIIDSKSKNKPRDNTSKKNPAASTGNTKRPNKNKN